MSLYKLSQWRNTHSPSCLERSGGCCWWANACVGQRYHCWTARTSTRAWSRVPPHDLPSASGSSSPRTHRRPGWPWPSVGWTSLSRRLCCSRRRPRRWREGWRKTTRRCARTSSCPGRRLSSAARPPARRGSPASGAPTSPSGLTGESTWTTPPGWSPHSVKINLLKYNNIYYIIYYY